MSYAHLSVKKLHIPIAPEFLVITALSDTIRERRCYKIHSLIFPNSPMNFESGL
jgi:hypothetical protein